jgi:hypothetical protein
MIPKYIGYGKRSSLLKMPPRMLGYGKRSSLLNNDFKNSWQWQNALAYSIMRQKKSLIRLFPHRWSTASSQARYIRDFLEPEIQIFF